MHRARLLGHIIPLCALIVVLQIIGCGGGGSSSTPPLTGKIVFTSNKDDGSGDIFTMNADGSGLTNLTHPAGTSDLGPCLSQDGAKITFARATTIWIVNSDGSSPQMLSNVGYCENPSLNSDGSKVVFNSWSYADSNCDIYVIDSSGAHLTRLTTDGETEKYPCFSPDGSKIAYVGDPGSGYDQIFIMDSDGSHQTQLTNDISWVTQPCFSPDGSKIAYEVDAGEVWIMNVDGTGQHKLFKGHAPCFSPDGSMIAFQSDRTGDEEIFIMNADGTDPVNVTNNPADDESPSWR
jgi:Tol biopolymer transport system component